MIPVTNWRWQEPETKEDRAKADARAEEANRNGLHHCAAAGSDGECQHRHCPNRDLALARGCPLPRYDDAE